MPTILTAGDERYFFYSANGETAPYVRVRAREREAMIWLHDLSVGANDGFADDDLDAIVRTVADRHDELLRSWNEHFGLRVG